MNDLRILVVEDRQNWQEALPQILQRLGGEVHVDVAPNYGAALQYISNEDYDLAIVDLALLGDPTDPRDADQLGMELLRELRNSRRNQGCALVVLTAYPTTARTRRALRDYAADDFIEKAEFDDRRFVEVAQGAILSARLRQAAVKAVARYRLTVTFSQEHLVGSELGGPDRRASYTASHPLRFNVTDLARRADNLNWMILQGGVGKWRHESDSIGRAIYDVLAGERHVLGDLIAARALAQRFSDLWLQFSGPAIGLGIPFELLRDEDDYLCLNHILTRRLVQSGASLSRKPEPFHKFLDGLRDLQSALRILVVGANSDGCIPVAEEEATSLATAIEADLQRLGIAHEIKLMTDTDATYTNVSRALRDGCYHVFHYAGHGRYDDELPEISGLVLRDDDESRTLTAVDLNTLTQDTELRLVFLSCCLGARTSANERHGDFYGMLEALARADIPTVLGYRWTVADDSATLLAKTFYKTLWRNFFPGEALLEARREVTLGQSRNDETWASPVLLMQNA
jgi:CheY-like chemotaxis protein